MSRDGDLETIKPKCLETIKKRFGNDKKALVETVWKLFGNVGTNPETVWKRGTFPVSRQTVFIVSRAGNVCLETGNDKKTFAWKL